LSNVVFEEEGWQLKDLMGIEKKEAQEERENVYDLDAVESERSVEPISFLRDFVAFGVES
jgi:hypothetical protein